MIEKALKGNRNYWLWLVVLGLVIAGGLAAYLRQFFEGLGVTGDRKSVV